MTRDTKLTCKGDQTDYGNLLYRIRTRGSYVDCKDAADTIEALRQRAEAADRLISRIHNDTSAGMVQLTLPLEEDSAAMPIGGSSELGGREDQTQTLKDYQVLVANLICIRDDQRDEIDQLNRKVDRLTKANSSYCDSNATLRKKLSEVETAATELRQSVTSFEFIALEHERTRWEDHLYPRPPQPIYREAVVRLYWAGDPPASVLALLPEVTHHGKR